MLARVRGHEHSPMMQAVRDANIHHIATRFRDRLLQVIVMPAYMMLLREFRRALAVPRENRHHLGIRHKPVIRLDVNIRNKAGPQQSNLRFRHNCRAE